MVKEFSAYSQRLAGFLMMKGFVVKLMRQDMKTRRNIFIFNDSEELQIALKRYADYKNNNSHN